MANVDISVGDIQRMYVGTLCCYKGEMVYFGDIQRDYTVLIMDVFSQKLKYVPFKEEDFYALRNGRLGYLNLGEVCAYISRVPVRKYAVGLDHNNFKIHFGDHNYNAGDRDVIMKLAGSFSNTAFFDTYNGIYPSFVEVMGKVKGEKRRCIAFDRQFALGGDGSIYYRGDIVGRINGKCQNEDDIIWGEDYQYLSKIVKPGFKVSEK